MRSGKRLHLWLVLAFIYIFLNIWPQGTHSAFILFIFFPPRFYPVLPVAGKVSHVDAPANSPSHALEHFNHQHSKAALRRYASDSSFLSLCLSPALSLCGALPRAVKCMDIQGNSTSHLSKRFSLPGWPAPLNSCQSRTQKWIDKGLYFTSERFIFVSYFKATSVP